MGIDTILFDDYIPYAISLNEAKNIEKYIENNEAYRKLLFGKTYTFLKQNFYKRLIHKIGDIETNILPEMAMLLLDEKVET